MKKATERTQKHLSALDRDVILVIKERWLSMEGGYGSCQGDITD